MSLLSRVNPRYSTDVFQAARWLFRSYLGLLSETDGLWFFSIDGYSSLSEPGCKNMKLFLESKCCQIDAHGGAVEHCVVRKKRKGGNVIGVSQGIEEDQAQNLGGRQRGWVSSERGNLGRWISGSCRKDLRSVTADRVWVSKPGCHTLSKTLLTSRRARCLMVASTRLVTTRTSWSVVECSCIWASMAITLGTSHIPSALQTRPTRG